MPITSPDCEAGHIYDIVSIYYLTYIVHAEDLAYRFVLHPANYPKALGSAPREDPKEDTLHFALDAVVNSTECHGLGYMHIANDKRVSVDLAKPQIALHVLIIFSLSLRDVVILSVLSLPLIHANGGPCNPPVALGWKRPFAALLSRLVGVLSSK